jgi:predicted AlkP superfamily pyrophosphatase or phosphodiesterase
MPLTIICAVGLTPDHLGSDTPNLNELARQGFSAPMEPVLPAVTTTAQTSMLTGALPSQHGIVANGWYFRELGEIWLWRQSQRLIDSELIWQKIRQGGRELTVLKHFWWYAMNTDVTASVTPRPVYHADGAKGPDVYTWPPQLKRILDDRHGTFPLFKFWGPTADIASTRWIAESFATAWNEVRPDLALCYLPHLDYDLQRFGPTGPHLSKNLRELDECCRIVIESARSHGSEVLVVSEYGLEAVDQGVPINKRLRQAGLLEVTTNATGELLDPGMSRAFAVADHQLAHVYCRDQADIGPTSKALEGLEGIERLYVKEERQEIGLDHPRSGEIVALAARGAWFQYEYWLDDRLRPDFANLVEIHKKPGYDPRELVFDPKGGKRRAAVALARKLLGFRYLMNPVSLDPSLVKGSHGRPPDSPELGPVIIGSRKDDARPSWHQTDVAETIRKICAPEL